MKLYVGRDEQNTLYLYTTKPTKSLAFWCTNSTDILKLDSNLLPEVKWEDEEPTEVELVIKYGTKENCPPQRLGD